MEMRKTYAAELEKLMRADQSIVTVDADVGKALGTDNFKNVFGARCIDVGIAEQNMIGVAAGLNSYSFKPVCQSFAPFVTRNVCDQITMNLCFTRLKALLVGADPGISAELNGATHMAMEDISVMRAIPGIAVFEPADEIELKAALPVLIDCPETVYMRMYRKELPVVHSPDYEFSFGKIDVLRRGKDVALFTSGIFVRDALNAAETLFAEGVSCSVINVHTLKPADAKGIAEELKKVKVALCVENHNVYGGLYSVISEINSSSPAPRRVGALGVRDRFGLRGTLPELKRELGLTERDIARKVRSLLDDLVD